MGQDGNIRSSGHVLGQFGLLLQDVVNLELKSISKHFCVTSPSRLVPADFNYSSLLRVVRVWLLGVFDLGGGVQASGLLVNEWW